MASPFYIGVDAGGSKSELLARAGSATLERTGDGVNLQRDGLPHSADVLALLVTEALRALDHDGTGHVCLGVAGAGRADEQQRLAVLLAERLFPEQTDDSPAEDLLTVEHDARIALEAAFPDESGMIVVVGTGSVVMARTEEGALARAGGWGARIGDEGSGMAIAEAGLGAVAASFDGGEPTALRDRVAETFDIHTPDDLIHAVYSKKWAVQMLAPVVVAAAEAGDWASTRILKTQANALAQRAGWLATRTEGVTPRVALLGGLVAEHYYRDSLIDALGRHLPGWTIESTERLPVEGALFLAERRNAERQAAERSAQEIDSGG